MTIISQGQEIEKIVDGERTIITPVVCGNGPRGNFGAGFIRPDGQKIICGSVAPQRLIQSWRAMQLVALVPQIESRTTLVNCWIAAQHKIYPKDRQFYHALAREFDPNYTLPGPVTYMMSSMVPSLFPSFRRSSRLESARHEILKSFPGQAEFSNMLDRVLRDGSYGVIEELVPLVKAGELPDLPQLAEIAQLHKARTAYTDARLEIMGKPDLPQRRVVEISGAEISSLRTGLPVGQLAP